MMSGLGAPGGVLSRIPGMGRLAGAGGIDPGALLGAGGGAVESRRALVKRQSKQRDKRKQARKARKKNRRR